MTIRKAMKDVIQTSDEYQAAETHFVNKRTELTDFEMSEWQKTTVKYHDVLIQAIDVLWNELKAVEKGA